MMDNEAPIFCGECWHFQNFPENAYNKIHIEIKECKIGNIVHAKVKACQKLARKKKRIKQSQSLKEGL